MGKGHREVDSRWLFTFRRVLEAGRWQKYSGQRIFLVGKLSFKRIA